MINSTLPQNLFKVGDTIRNKEFPGHCGTVKDLSGHAFRLDSGWQVNPQDWELRPKSGDWVKRGDHLYYVSKVVGDFLHFLAHDASHYRALASGCVVIDPRSSKHWPVMQQWLAGATVGYEDKAGHWLVLDLPSWLDCFDYRVKPEEIKVGDWVDRDNRLGYVTKVLEDVVYLKKSPCDSRAFRSDCVKTDPKLSKHWPLMQQWVAGATVEAFILGSWTTLEQPSWLDRYDYRAKPEEIKVGGWVTDGVSIHYLESVADETFKVKGYPGTFSKRGQFKPVDPSTHVHWPLMQAWLEGVGVQLQNACGNWLDEANPAWTTHVKYRLKLEEIQVGDWVVSKHSDTGKGYLVEAVAKNELVLKSVGESVCADKYTKITTHKHWELMQKWAAGAPVEYRNSLGYWCGTLLPSWNRHVDYRVKPKITVQEICLRLPSGPLGPHNVEATYEDNKLISVKLI